MNVEKENGAFLLERSLLRRDAQGLEQLDGFIGLIFGRHGRALAPLHVDQLSLEQFNLIGDLNGFFILLARNQFADLSSIQADLQLVRFPDCETLIWD